LAEKNICVKIESTGVQIMRCCRSPTGVVPVARTNLSSLGHRLADRYERPETPRLP
jgi:hypothetical protein